MRIPAPRRPWLRFSLRAMLIALLVVALGLGWLTRTAKVLRKRDEMIRSTSAWSFYPGMPEPPITWKIVALLWGYDKGAVYWEGIQLNKNFTSGDLQVYRTVFPEARVALRPEDVDDIEPPAYRNHLYDSR